MTSKMVQHRTLLALTVVVLLARAALAQDEKSWSLDLGLDYSDRYLFRGVPILNTNAVLVPHATLSVGAFAIYYNGYAGDLPADSTLSAKIVPYREGAVGGDYSVALAERFSLTLGVVSYIYSKETTVESSTAATYEIYAIAAFEGVLSPSISYYRDMDAINGDYAAVAVSHRYPIGRKASLILSTSVGLDLGYNLGSETASDLDLRESNGDLNDLLVGIDLPIQINDWLNVHALVQHSFSLDVLDRLGVQDETVFTVGVGLTF
jgi:hypothetical protein